VWNPTHCHAFILIGERLEPQFEKAGSRPFFWNRRPLSPVVDNYSMEIVMITIKHQEFIRDDYYSGEITRKLDKMNNHHIFSMVTDVSKLQTFMEWHVFAVWDFMSLVKRLQWDFTCETVPWLPPSNNRAARLINEIVLGEETDDAPGGAHASHFELYISAMTEVGASTNQINSFIELLQSGTEVDAALDIVSAPAAVVEFVRATVETARNAPTHEVLGSFFYGREHSIPIMFQSLLNRWTVDPHSAPTFVYYLNRHIELDRDDHGPAVEAIISEIMDDSYESWTCFWRAALKAIELRIGLWDGLANCLEARDAQDQAGA
jgi:hypothetical protein